MVNVENLIGRLNAAEAVIAATAGRNTWQTWAGRSHGTEDFEVLDVFRGIKRSINHSLGTKLPKPGTPCPICFCEPSDTALWHVTWCGHAVCKDCLGQYAASQVGDLEHHGPLQCPICLEVAFVPIYCCEAQHVICSLCRPFWFSSLAAMISRGSGGMRFHTKEKQRIHE